jgi:hypothetical protein
MALIARSRVALTWDAGSPGVNTYYWTAGVPSPLDWTNSADQFHTELADAYRAMNGYINNVVSWSVEDTFDIIDVESGNIVDQRTLTGTDNFGQGTGTGTSGPRMVQAYVGFLTDLFSSGRRLRGGVYIGPLGGDTANNTGGFGVLEKNVFEGAFASLISGLGPRIAVYHRPAQGNPGGGFYADVVQSRLKMKPAILRSRRD